MSLVSAQWMPAVSMKRIICHWTAGTNTANATDKKAYHLLIEGDGTVVKGNTSIADNSGSLKDGYAAHTLNCNTDSIGVSMCAMAGAVESPFKPGSYPITKEQWAAFIKVVAELAAFYKIAVTNKTILFHAEVQANLGITQKNKWDVTRLVFEPSVVGAAAVGSKMRSEVLAAMSAPPEVVLVPIPVGAIAITSTGAKTSSVKGQAANGSLPSGTTVEVIAVDGNSIQIETPAGYLVWASRADFQVVNGPAVENGAKPDPKRQIIADIRKLLDDLEADLA